MSTSNHNIPDREISEDEDELLNRLWEGLLPASSKEASSDDYGDLQRRIGRKLRLRRTRRIVAATGIAALMVIFFLIYGGFSLVTEPDVYVQVRQIGSKFIPDQILLTMDDGTKVPLDSVAQIEPQSLTQMAVNTISGKKMSLAKSRLLRVEVPVGRTFRLMLADSTQVWLNAGSSLEYPASFENSEERHVRLSGEAFFEVQQDTNHPFYVELSDGEMIRVLGTSFNVNAYPEASEHTTTLLSGKISYSPGESKETIVLLPDQQVSMNCAGKVVNVRQVDAAFYAAWKEGWIWFENEKLSQLAGRLSRLFGIEIQVAEKYRDYSFSGKIRKERGIDYITKLLTETTTIVCRVDGEVIKLE